jgi:predicted O-linked N-acetylglucosamine transferase (SPINDLY family)
MDKKHETLKGYRKIIDKTKNLIYQSIDSNNSTKTQELRLQAIDEYNKLLHCIDITDYLLLDSKPLVPEDVFVESNFNLGTLYKTHAESLLQQNLEELRKNGTNRQSHNVEGQMSEEHVSIFRKALSCFTTILRVRFEDELAQKQILSIFTQMCFHSQNNIQSCIQFLQEALLFVPQSETIHYNLGFVYQKMNKLELSIIHYKLSLELAKHNYEAKNQDHIEKEESRKLILNNYNGISCIYRSIKQWPEALHYLRKAEKVDPLDPDVQNQLGVVYTEMRRTDLAEEAYKKAIKNYKRTFISTDSKSLLSEIHLNFGHMHSYNGNNEQSVENYNKALNISPKFTLPFQNKIMNLSYFFDQLDDKMYILKQHKLVNKLYKKGNGMFKFQRQYFQTNKINIGIISGDFVDHPVSFYISTFLKNFDHEKFSVTCYSECIIDTSLFSDKLQFKFIKNMSAQQAACLVHNDKIHILFDLAGHTAFNRLDIFALKPCPSQVTYIGYPYSTGLAEMDYRITDDVCDNLEVSQKFYTEKLICLRNCFLCYDPTVIRRPNGNTSVIKVPELTNQPFIENGYLTIGCFNRLNKMTDSVIKLFNQVLLRHKTVKFIFKTKALINKNIQQKFLAKFDKTVRNRITVLNCTILHEDHLLEYNKIDLAIDTFPYSGTTTSCEALYMGVPVFTMYDSEYYFHAQNVTASILANSGEELKYYIFNKEEELHEKLIDLNNRSKNEFWERLKPSVRDAFLRGDVCNKEKYMKNFSELLYNLYTNSSAQV